MNNDNIEITNNLEEKLLHIVLNYCREGIEENETDVNAVTKMRDVKICKKLKKIHALIGGILKSNKIERLSEEDLKVK